MWREWDFTPLTSQKVSLQQFHKYWQKIGDSHSETIEFITQSTDGSMPSCLHPFASFPNSHRNISRRASWVNFAHTVGLNHIWGISSSRRKKKIFVRGQLANLLNFFSEAMCYLYYSCEKINRSSTPEENSTSIFQTCLQSK